MTLHGNDLFDPRSNRLSRAILPLTALPAAVSREFSSLLPGAGTTRRVAVLPVGHRPRALPADPAARGQGAARPGPRRALSPVPARPRAAAEALRPRAGGRRRRDAADDGPGPARRGPVLDQRGERRARAVSGGGVRAVGARGAGVRRAGVRDAGRDPSGGAGGHRGAFCAAWDRDAWRAALRPVLEADDPRVDGRARAELFSADRMAARVVAAWRDVVAEHSPGAPSAPAVGLIRRGPRSRPYTRLSGARADRAPLRRMSGLLRRLRRRRPATADETQVPRPRPPSRPARLPRPPPSRAAVSPCPLPGPGDAGLAPDQPAVGRARRDAAAGGDARAAAPSRRPRPCATFPPASIPASSSSARRRARAAASCGGGFDICAGSASCCCATSAASSTRSIAPSAGRRGSRTAGSSRRRPSGSRRSTSRCAGSRAAWASRTPSRCCASPASAARALSAASCTPATLATARAAARRSTRRRSRSATPRSPPRPHPTTGSQRGRARPRKRPLGRRPASRRPGRARRRGEESAKRCDAASATSQWLARPKKPERRPGDRPADCADARGRDPPSRAPPAETPTTADAKPAAEADAEAEARAPSRPPRRSRPRTRDDPERQAAAGPATRSPRGGEGP